jgi:hypothetical protein
MTVANRLKNGEGYTYDYIVAFELKGIRRRAFIAESFAVDESAVGASNVLNENLTKIKNPSDVFAGSQNSLSYLVPVLPDFCMRPAQDFRVKVPISFVWSRLRVGLTPDFHPLLSTACMM